MSKAEQGIKGAEGYLKTIELAKAGKLDDIDPKMFLVYYNTIKNIRKDYMPIAADNSKVSGVWIQGEAGIGKSYTLRQILKSSGFYQKMRNQWWDGYINQEYVICDDIGPFDVKLGGLIKDWADSYAFTCETKGGALSIRPKLVFFTSQYPISEIWKDQQTVDAVRRRCVVVNLFDDTEIPKWAETKTLEQFMTNYMS